MSEEQKKQKLELTTKQKQYLKGLAHPMNPLVQIGKEGISSGLIDSTKKELLNHELIKVKIGSNSNLEKHETSQLIAEKSESVLVQLIGKTIVLYKPNPKKAKDKRIYLPKASNPTSRKLF
ncbi:MAG: ribosome assembly RNA-binding protein YhbY [Desulfobulbaceae bacterium]|nr:ribosome assembly RNA-binding protein YhbY [Desulfobulbaceae bacterium]